MRIMNNILYLIAIVMIIFWIIGFFVYTVGAVIHLLLIIAAMAILLRLISGREHNSS